MTLAGSEEMYDFLVLFDSDNIAAKRNAHPAEVVPYFLGTSNLDVNMQRMKQLELWYMGYQKQRGTSMLFKAASDVAGGSNITNVTVVGTKTNGLSS